MQRLWTHVIALYFCLYIFKQSVTFSCKVTGSCSGNKVYWYQKKEGEAFTWINFDANSGSSDTAHPQRADFYIWRDVKQVQDGKQAWGQGSNQRKPKVTVYPASNSESNGKTTLLCLARDMFPDLVKISWKIEDANGGRMEVSKAETEQLEQREEGQTTSMIIIDKEKTYRNKYVCSVEHEWGAQQFDIPKGKASN
uniref:Ig-like domain-containing protein n=1 Tax=Salmo trutta TaxID=8032 RepID=A0A673WTW7_SALTR